MTDHDSAVTAAELDELQKRLKSRDAIAECNPGPAIVLCEKAADTIASLRKQLAEARGWIAAQDVDMKRLAFERDEARAANSQMAAALRTIASAPASYSASILARIAKDNLTPAAPGEDVHTAHTLAASPSPGMVLVPREPTEAMKFAGGLAYENAIFGEGAQVFDAAGVIYQAMIAEATASPSPGLRFCDYCKAWSSKPCGEQCVWTPDCPTIEQMNASPSPGLRDRLGVTQETLDLIESEKKRLGVTSVSDVLMVNLRERVENFQADAGLREAVIEECAKVADQFGDRHGEFEVGDAIRALATKEDGA